MVLYLALLLVLVNLIAVKSPSNVTSTKMGKWLQQYFSYFLLILGFLELIDCSITLLLNGAMILNEIKFLKLLVVLALFILYANSVRIPLIQLFQTQSSKRQNVFSVWFCGIIFCAS